VQVGEGILKIWAFECSGLAWFCKWKPELLNFITRWRHLCYNLFNILQTCAQNNALLNCTKNCISSVGRVHDKSSQTYNYGLFGVPPLVHVLRRFSVSEKVWIRACVVNDANKTAETPRLACGLHITTDSLWFYIHSSAHKHGSIGLYIFDVSCHSVGYSYCIACWCCQ